nr:hypothetical protein [Providencia rettgeri]
MSYEHHSDGIQSLFKVHSAVICISNESAFLGLKGMISHLLLGSNSKTEINFIFFHTFPPPKKLRTIIITIPPRLLRPSPLSKKTSIREVRYCPLAPKNTSFCPQKNLFFAR